jgi:hypothetical protein
MRWLKVFFKNLLGFTDGLNGQFLITHWLELRAIEPGLQLSFADIVPVPAIGGGAVRARGPECFAVSDGERLWPASFDVARRTARPSQSLPTQGAGLDGATMVGSIWRTARKSDVEKRHGAGHGNTGSRMLRSRRR